MRRDKVMFSNKLFKSWIVGFIIAIGSCNSAASQNLQAGLTNQGYFTGDRIPGNPENGEKVLREIYRLVNVYRQRNGGVYPKSLLDVRKDASADLAAYGVPSMQHFWQNLKNADNLYSDNPFERQSQDMLAEVFNDKRHNGDLLGKPKLHSTRDVIAYNSLYFHRNFQINAKGQHTRNPIGFYQILWDDGQIERVDYDRMLYVPNELAFSIAFRGEAGVPSNSLTYQEFETALGNKERTLPIGFPLLEGKGESVADNGAYESLTSYAISFGTSINRHQVWDALGKDEREFSLRDVKAAAAKLKIPLVETRLSLELHNENFKPAILYLENEHRFVTLLAVGEKHCIVVEQGMTRIMSKDALSLRYSGLALVHIEQSSCPLQ
ncbi:MAG TPA: cysteine peptidase family C39 domain-containing protein, partial [Abditibacteriaceae bacterium]